MLAQPLASGAAKTMEHGEEVGDQCSTQQLATEVAMIEMETSNCGVSYEITFCIS
jgi:hypothetical protein